MAVWLTSIFQLMIMPGEEFPRIYLYRRIVKAKLFIDANFSEKIDLNEIADEAYFSKFHFIRLFSKIYGRTPHQYLIEVRVLAAKKLLEQGKSALETSMHVGFESATSFNGLFKKLTGQTPLAYQQEYKNRLIAINKNPFQFIPNCFSEIHGLKEKSNFREG